MALIKTEAILLKGTNYRDKSKIITLYTRSHGRVSVIAKGVRDTKNKMGGALQSMAYLNVMFYYNVNRTLHLLSAADHVKSFVGIYDDYEKMKIGFRMVELVHKTSEDSHENTALFDLLAAALSELNAATKNYVNLLFYFEFRLAAILGFALNLSDPEGILVHRAENRGLGPFPAVTLAPGDIKNLEALTGGNFNTLSMLNISKASEKSIDKFFEAYFMSHVENLSSSRAQKVMES
jgi:DNA repair protein RecO (recombination protein O)